MKLDAMTKDERSLLLFFETCAVDQRGGVDGRRINDADREIAQRWNECGFVLFGRMSFKDVSRLHKINVVRTDWCELSDEAWKLAHEERRARAARMAKDRKYKKTSEVRQAV